jgi:hypothetical protein
MDVPVVRAAIMSSAISFIRRPIADPEAAGSLLIAGLAQGRLCAQRLRPTFFPACAMHESREPEFMAASEERSSCPEGQTLGRIAAADDRYGLNRNTG